MVELMVVVAILGITAAVSLRSFTRNPTGEDARKVAGLMSTAYRTAVGGGAVRSDVALATGIKARAQIEFSVASGQFLVTVYKLVEDALPLHSSSWVPVSTAILSPDVEVYAITAAAATLPGSAPTASAFGTPITKSYFPDGTSDAFTVFLRLATNIAATRYRVVGMPLSPAPQMYRDW